MLDKKQIKRYIENLNRFWYSKEKVSRILDIDKRTIQKVLNWGFVSESINLKILNNYDLFVATFIKDLK